MVGYVWRGQFTNCGDEMIETNESPQSFFLVGTEEGFHPAFCRSIFRSKELSAQEPGLSGISAYSPVI